MGGQLGHFAHIIYALVQHGGLVRHHGWVPLYGRHIGRGGFQVYF